MRGQLYLQNDTGYFIARVFSAYQQQCCYNVYEYVCLVTIALADRK